MTFIASYMLKIFICFTSLKDTKEIVCECISRTFTAVNICSLQHTCHSWWLNNMKLDWPTLWFKA